MADGSVVKTAQRARKSAAGYDLTRLMVGGEHGIGQGKMKYLKAELGEGVAMMRAIKAAVDPLNIFNPGKILAM
jgi:FAD/FMN-containing dehydrogenase